MLKKEFFINLQSGIDYTENESYFHIRFKETNLLGEVIFSQFSAIINHIYEIHTSPTIILNLENIHTISSTMIGQITNIHRKALEKNGKLILCSISSQISDVFEITKLNNILSIAKNFNEALSLIS